MNKNRIKNNLTFFKFKNIIINFVTMTIIGSEKDTSSIIIVFDEIDIKIFPVIKLDVNSKSEPYSFINNKTFKLRKKYLRNINS